MLNKSSSVADAAAEPSVSQSFSIKQNKVLYAFFGVLATLFELVTDFGIKLFRLSVIFWTTFSSRVLAPASVYGLSLASFLFALSKDALVRLRTSSHDITVSINNFRKNRLILAMALFSVTLVLIASTFYKVGIKITVDGEKIGYMSSREEYDEALRFVELRASEILERPYSITENVRFELGIVQRDEIISKEAIRSYFFSKIDEVSMLYALTVDGEVVGASYYKETLQRMIDELLDVNDPNVKSHFTQNVQISQKYVDSSKLISYDEIREKLTSTIHSKKQYTIRAGDTINSIAKANGMTKEDLLELNPGLRSSNLRAGKKVTVAKAVPFLSIESVRRVEYTETIPYETKTVEDSSIYKGSSKVVTQGRVGTRKVVADITYVDNKETSRKILSNVVTSQPITKVVHVGTKPRPKTMATGKLSRPVSGAIISSNYGMRRGSMHKGVDFAARTGTRINAADGGTVTWAGWKRGGWGYLVVINHGNGLETFYAHNSKVLVSVGQKVAKGQQIAKMGSTGNSTGPHVHFEIHKNGRYVNPWKYIS